MEGQPDKWNEWIFNLRVPVSRVHARTWEGVEKKMKAEAAAGDEIGDPEGEDFETGMRQNAAERDAADADNDGKLDFAEFCVFVRDREEGEFTEEDLRKRFNALDEDGSGKVDMDEYLHMLDAHIRNLTPASAAAQASSAPCSSR